MQTTAAISHLTKI
ncbi:hypothetical protein E2C01_080954 [Portunus trituberculatus]|uniref:Uncharacterized protein n=1 Tax=Portunus trituberculatus TaxID=210409 RepID=A0A5B7IZR3_PORTR|nr:hypothetical protein [Portunus trituberculatus]